MTVAASLSVTLAALVVAAALEGLLAGRGVRQYLASLRQPSWGPPFAAWIAIGGLYYLVFGTVLYRLLRLGTIYPSQLALVAAILLINAGWNYLFFRKRSLAAAARANVPYGFLVAALFVSLLKVDHIGALLLVPYLLYLVFALAWTRALQRLNPAAPLPSS